MSGFFVSLVILTASGSIILNLLPTDSATERHVRYAVGMITASFILTAVLPYLSGIGDITAKIKSYIADASLTETSGSADDWIISESADNIAKSVAELVSRRFRVPVSDVAVSVTLDKSDVTAVRVTKLTVVLSGDGVMLGKVAVREYVADLLFTECEVYYDGES